MSTRNRTSDFLAALALPPSESAPAPTKQPRERVTVAKAPKARAATPAAPAPTPAAADRHHSRVDRKHFGGYLDAETLEIAAVLRVRLKMDNSELIKYALEELDRSHKAKRAFGDA